MALALMLRSACRSKASPIVSQVSRISSVASLQSGNLPFLNNHRGVTLNQNQSLLSNELVRKISVSPVRMSGGLSHVTIWQWERILGIGMLGIIPAAIAYPSQIGDVAMAVTMVVHAHWGLDAIVTDYIRPILFGNLIPPMAHGFLLLFSAATLGGLFLMIYNDVGIAKTIRNFWAIKPYEKKE
jgi:succinate dehydrogenase (ubiquinone) membrane anchor subunit